MIQELLGGGKEINIFSSVPFPTPLPFTSPPPSSSSTTTTCPTTHSDSKTTLPNTSNSTCVPNNTNNNNSNSNSNNNNNSSETNNQQKLRCPRCDSTNTKFCYYNNYNLTQPRHFCKTCRRYWTKGGTLRNVPIGGGCRKNKTISSTTSSSSPSSSMSVSAFSKSSLSALFRSAKGPLSTELLFPSLIGNGALDPQLDIPNPTFWPPPPPQNSHIRAFLNPNPNPTQGLFDPYGANGAPTTHLGSSFHRSSHQHQVVNGLSNQDHNMVLNGGNINNSNIMELYQKLKSSSGYGYGYYSGHENHGPLNLVGPTSSSPPLSSSMYMISNAIREGSAGDNMGIQTWPTEFTTLPINGALFP